MASPDENPEVSTEPGVPTNTEEEKVVAAEEPAEVGEAKVKEELVEKQVDESPAAPLPEMREEQKKSETELSAVEQAVEEVAMVVEAAAIEAANRSAADDTMATTEVTGAAEATTAGVDPSANVIKAEETTEGEAVLPPEKQENSTSKSSQKSGKKRVRRVGLIGPRKKPNTEDASPTEATPPRVLSKHDEKWNQMFQKLVDYKSEHGSTLVPQCYDQDPRLGRWVHYQRVEYWIYQQNGTGKITPDRISRLEAVGFEWDPQRAQWNNMFLKLQQFKEEHSHCKVPKGYTKDPELANWVRNQRLEHANLVKGKKTRMTHDRFEKLNNLGFRWSTLMPPRGANAAKTAVTNGLAPKQESDGVTTNAADSSAAEGKATEETANGTDPKSSEGPNAVSEAKPSQPTEQTDKPGAAAPVDNGVPPPSAPTDNSGDAGAAEPVAAKLETPTEITTGVTEV